MDPTWNECKYCKQENVAPAAGPVPPVSLGPVSRNPTVVEGYGQDRAETHMEGGSLPPRPQRMATPEAPARVGGGAGQPVRQRAHTEYSPVGTQAVGTTTGPVPQVQRERRIVGVLVSYSWTPEGKVYPIREGRNLIGRDEDCEVCIAEDQTLSGRNSHITFRQNFVIGDLVSMTGTDVDGVPIEEQFRALANYATVRAGSTYFTFIAIQPPGA
jgi:hypothetical protein